MAYNEEGLKTDTPFFFFVVEVASEHEGGVMNEGPYQNQLIKKLTQLLPGCFVLKNDPAKNQGVPDILILFKKRWAMLEVKRSGKAAVRPNQKHYVDMFNGMSFAAFIHPENEDKVLRDLQSTFGSKR